MSKVTLERDGKVACVHTTQCVENADGTISEVPVVLRRSKAAHDRQLRRERARRSGNPAGDSVLNKERELVKHPAKTPSQDTPAK